MMCAKIIRRWLSVLAIGLALFGVAAAEIADFENLTPATPYGGPGGGNYWNGSDLCGTPRDVLDPWNPPSTMTLYESQFQSGGVTMPNTYNATYGSWSQWSYSNTSDTTTGDWTNQFSAFPGTGAGPGADNYGVMYGPTSFADPTELPWMSVAPGTAFTSMSVTNTTYAALTMQNGDAFAKQFGGATGTDPDWYLLTVYGEDNGGSLLPQTVDFYLADYRFANDSLDYIVDDWQSVDLTSMTGATKLYLGLTSSDTGAWGMNTPAYVAVDNIVTSPVPEPATLAMFGIGICCVGGWAAWRRRKK